MGLSGNRRAFRPTGPLLALGLVVVLVTLAWLGMEHVFGVLEWLESQVEAHFWPALAAYFVAFVLLILTTLPVGTLFCLAGGYFFGLGLGAGTALVAATLGATLTYLLVGALGGQRVREWISHGRMEPWLRLLERDATWYLILLRVIPITPFFIVNAAAGLTRIGPLHFILASGLGLVPTTFIYAAVGRGLEAITEAREIAGPKLLLEPAIGLPLLALVGLLVVAWVVHHRLHRQAAGADG